MRASRLRVVKVGVQRWCSCRDCLCVHRPVVCSLLVWEGLFTANQRLCLLHATLCPAEVPIVDGSALGWANEVLRCGLRSAPTHQTADAPIARAVWTPEKVRGALPHSTSP